MALFGKKKTEEVQKESVAAPVKGVKVSRDLSHVLKTPRITEKAGMHQAAGVYTFDVADSTTKSEVVQAVRAQYGVSPRKVRVVSIHPKMRRSMRTGRVGFTRGGKKAYVYLKKGESITIS